MIFPIIVMIVSPKIGFEWAIRIVAFVTAFLLIVANLLIRTRLPLNKKAGASVDFKSLADTKYALTTVAVWFIELANFIPILISHRTPCTSASTNLWHMH